jgi:ribosomal protein L37AE/L43A
MKKTVSQEGKNIWQCEACGLHYREEAQAKRCEEWCTMHASCNLDITCHAVELQNDDGKTS